MGWGGGREFERGLLLIVIILDFSVLSIAQAHLRTKEERERVADLKEEEEEQRKKRINIYITV